MSIISPLTVQFDREDPPDTDHWCRWTSLLHNDHSLTGERESRQFSFGVQGAVLYRNMLASCWKNSPYAFFFGVCVGEWGGAMQIILQHL